MNTTVLYTTQQGRRQQAIFTEQSKALAFCRLVREASAWQGMKQLYPLDVSFWPWKT